MDQPTLTAEQPTSAADRPSQEADRPEVRLEHRLLELHRRYAGEGLPRPSVARLGLGNLLAVADPPRMRANVHLAGDSVLIGPSGGGPAAPVACGHCVGLRWQRLRTRSERDAWETGLATGAAGDWPPLTGFAEDAVWAIYRAVMPGDRRDAGPARAGRELPRVTRIELSTLRVTTFPILADPLCPSCRPPSEEWTPPALGSRPKPRPDTWRLTPSEGYRLPEAALVNPVCGVLSAGTMLTVTSPTTTPVTGSVFVRSYAGLIDMSWSGQANSFAASRALSMLEGLERYAGTHPRQPHPPVVESYAALGEAALNPAECGFYAPETYRDDPQVTPFAPDRKIPWVWGYSLRDERPILVPRRLCYYSTGAVGDNFAFTSSNGCAIGSCLEEALLFGLLELIERDAFLLAWYGGARLTEIDLASCGGARLPAMVERAKLHGYDVHAFDTRIDLAVPVVTGLAVRRDRGPGALSFAAGASLDPRTAVESALAEVLTYIPQMHRQTVRRWAELEAMADDFTKVRHLADHSGLFGLPRMRKYARRYLEDPPIAKMAELYTQPIGADSTSDLLDDLRWCRDELVRAGHDVIVVEQTTPEQRWLGLNAACAIVPGLLPIDFGWSRQRALGMPRLRTAFRRAGWRTTDLSDAEIHRVPHPFP